VHIDGTVTAGAQPSFAYYRGDFSITASSVPTVDIKNNILSNYRAGGTGKHYAIANGYPNVASSATGWGANASDYNILNTPEAPVGFWSGDKAMADWKIASAGDANSLNGVTVNFVAPASNLHLVHNANAAIDNLGTPLADVVVDFDLEARSATTPDIGADEFTYVMPVTLVYFNGTKQENKNLLNWMSNCTGAFAVFSIERSSDGRDFKSQYQFSATADRCARPFDYTDAAPLPGTNYYRLKMTDADGKSSYSWIVAIINKERGIAITAMKPSVVERTTTVSIVSGGESRADMRIVDMGGRIIYTRSINLTAGNNAISVELSAFAPGVYQLILYSAEGERSSIRFIKQ
jgi:hypothetical protein